MRRFVLALIAALFISVNVANAQSVSTFTYNYSGENSGSEWNPFLTNAQRCTETEPVYGAQPSTPGKYPVFIYLHGTYADWAGNPDGKLFVQQAAAQGFVAIAIQYDSAWTLNVNGDTHHAFCIFDQNHTGNPISQVCAMAEADCSHGLLVSGFSQGAAIAMGSKNMNPNVKAVWAIGTGGSAGVVPQLEAAPLGTRALPNNKLRINVGQNDSSNFPSGYDTTGLQEYTGDNCGSSFNCLQPDGSGYYVVSNNEVADGNADHCYWQSVNTTTDSCTWFISNFDPGFQPPAMTPWSLISNLNWLKSQLQ